MSGKGNLNKRFQDFGATPDPGSWAQISAALPEKGRKKAIVWWLTGGIGVAASILFAVLVLTPGSDHSDSSRHHVENSKTKHDHNTAKESKPNTTINGHNNLTKNTNDIVKDKNTLRTNREIPEDNSQGVSQNKPVGNLPVHEGNQKIETINSITTLAYKEEKETNVIDHTAGPAIKLLSHRETILLAVNDTKKKMERKEVLNLKSGSLRWGGGLNSGLGIGNNAMLASNAVDISANANWYDISEDIINGTQPTFPVHRVNRPVIGNLFLRFNLNRRIFLEPEINATWLSAKHDLVKSSLNPEIAFISNRTNFFAIGSAFRFGYEFIQKKRWAIDISTGIKGEKILKKKPYVIKGQPLFLWGSSSEIGLSFHFSEKLSCRLAPRFDWIFGQADNQFYTQFQNQKNLGLGLKLLRNF